MKLRAVIFDLDGTLADTIPLCITSYQYAFKTLLGRSFTDEEVMALFGPNEEGIFKQVALEQWEQGVDLYHSYYADNARRMCGAVFDGMEEVLQLLKRHNVALAVVTGKGIHSALYTLEYLGIRPYFDRVEAGAPEGVIKSSAIGNILTAWQIPARDAAYVGDAAYDMQEARVAGVLPIGACWSATATACQASSEQAFPTFTTIADFTYWLQEHC